MCAAIHSSSGASEPTERGGSRRIVLRLAAVAIVVPGIEDVSVEVPRAVVRLLQAASRRGVRIASICSGAFVLAAAGLLDGRRATTHWLCADELQRRYPDVTVDPNVLYVDEGQIITSAGASAGLDMCLHLVRRDFGQAFAAKAARLAVTPVALPQSRRPTDRYPCSGSRASCPYRARPPTTTRTQRRCRCR